MVNPYLFAAFSVVWAIFVVYVWILSRRQAQLQKELEELRRRLHEQASSGARPPQS
ncbi:MAG TPA: CcmD family protein [Terriglobia bacterium]|nr:CcmD family protein [Terriglobia bacterium]